MTWTTKYYVRYARSRGVLTAAVMLTFAGTAGSQTADDYQRLGQDAGKVIGAYNGATILLEFCAAKFPSLREGIRRGYQELETTNSSIVTMARNKLYAASELTEGASSRGRIDKMFEDVRNQLRTNFAASENLRAICDANAAPDVRPWKVQDKYPQEYVRITEFKIGYPWRPLACDYQMTFPVRPDVQTVQVERQTTLRAITPEGNLPTITAACWPRGAGSDQNAIAHIKSNGMQALRDFGVKNLRLVEDITPKGHVLHAVGEKSANGLDVVAEDVIYLGKTSILEVTIIDSNSAYPSLIGSQFLDWIEKSVPPR
jgi:hypothetical protein